MWELVEDDEVIDEVEVLDDEPAPKAPLRAKPVPANGSGTKEGDTTETRKRLRNRDDEDDDRPAKSKKKKKRAGSRTIVPVDEDQESRDRALREFEFIWPLILLVAGMAMTFVGAFGASDGVSAFVTVAVMAVGLIITIPLSIVVLMVIGLFLGIEYGRIGPAILKIAAISFVVNGVYFLGSWASLPFFVIFPIGCGVSFGLFMAQFDLDTWETNASVGSLNIMTFIANIVLIGFLVVADAGKTGDPFEDEGLNDNVPGEVQEDDDFDDGFGDDWDDEP